MPSLQPLTLLGALSLAGLPVAATASEAPIETPRIVVTADPLGDRTADELATPVTVIEGEELERRRGGTLGETLDGLPGIANSDFGPGVGRPVIRGQQGSRVKVLADGLTVADVSGEGADHAIGLDPAHADQIEILRGPATLIYGSGAVGGVVNVRTRRFAPDFGPSTRLAGALSYGFNGDDRQGRLAVEQPLGTDAVLRAEYAARRTNDFDIKGFQQEDQTAGNEGKLRISDIDSDSGALSAVFRGDWGHFGIGYSRFATDYGIPENFDARPRDLGGQEDHFERVTAESDRFDLRGEFLEPFAGIASARIKMAWTRFEQEEAEFEFERTPEGGELDEVIVEAAFRNDEFEGRLELLHHPIGDWRGVLGLQYGDRDFFADDPRGPELGFYVRPNRTRTLAAFLLEELPTGFGRFEVGARIERERSRAEDFFGYRVAGITQADGSFLPFPETLPARRFSPFSVSGGMVVDIDSDHHFKTSLSRSQRAPSPEQLYAFGRHPAAGTFEVGDPDLRKETYTHLELGFDRHQGPFRYDLNLFVTRVGNYIFLLSEDDGTGAPVAVNDIGNRAGEGAAADCAPDAGGLCRLRNQLVVNTQANAEFYGMEFAAVADLDTGALPLSLRFSGDHVRGKLRGGGNLPRITPTRLGIGLDTGADAWRLSVDYRHVFRQSRVGVAESATDGFDLVSFDFAWTPGWLGDGQIFLKGRNLLNENGRLHQSFFKDEAPIIGRAFITGLRFGFGG
jgi:iron complex outermembrane receptor protein